MTSQANQFKRSIFVIEDNIQIAKLLEFMLEREGFKVTLLGDGDVALTAMESTEAVPDLIILDLTLPYIDGFSLLQRFQASANWSNTPVIVLSGKSKEQDIVKALKKGAADYVTKPFLPSELLARIHRLINTE
jgi:DNA-binding response OmpR family regulator